MSTNQAAYYLDRAPRTLRGWATAGAEWDGYRARIAAKGTRLDALGKQSTALLEGFRAGAGAVEAQANANISLWNASVTN